MNARLISLNACPPPWRRRRCAFRSGNSATQSPIAPTLPTNPAAVPFTNLSSPWLYLGFNVNDRFGPLSLIPLLLLPQIWYLSLFSRLTLFWWWTFLWQPDGRASFLKFQKKKKIRSSTSSFSLYSKSRREKFWLEYILLKPLLMDRLWRLIVMTGRYSRRIGVDMPLIPRRETCWNAAETSDIPLERCPARWEGRALSFPLSLKPNWQQKYIF